MLLAENSIRLFSRKDAAGFDKNIILSRKSFLEDLGTRMRLIVFPHATSTLTQTPRAIGECTGRERVLAVRVQNHRASMTLSRKRRIFNWRVTRGLSRNFIGISSVCGGISGNRNRCVFQYSYSDDIAAQSTYRTGLSSADEPPSAESCEECQLQVFPLLTCAQEACLSRRFAKNFNTLASRASI